MTDYSNALNEQPRALETLRARVSNIKRTDSKMQGWVQAVAEATEAHAQQLQQILSKHAINESELGTLGAPWDAVASVILANASASADSARRLRSEVYQPMRDLAKRYDRSTSAVTADASYSSSCAAEVQQADLEHASAVRDALLRMQTLLVDAAQEIQRTSERTSQTLLNWNPSDEPDSFVAQIVSGVAPTKEATPHGRHHQPQPRAMSSQTFIHNATRKPSRMSLPESEHSEKKKTGLRAKVGSIFRKPKNQHSYHHQMSPIRTPSERAVSEAPSNEGSSRLGRAPSSASRPPQQPTSTQPPDFGLKHRDLRSTPQNDEPLSSVRARASSNENAPLGPSPAIGGPPSGGPPVQPRNLSSPTTSPSDSPLAPGPTSTNAFAVSGPTSNNVGATSAPANTVLQPTPRSGTSTSSHHDDAPTVPPPRGGRKINSIYFSGVSAAPRESMVEMVPEDRPLETSAMASSTTSLARTGSLRRDPIKREFTGQQSQHHPSLPLVEGPAASLLESLVVLDRSGVLENVAITGDVRFAAPTELQLQVLNARHLSSFIPSTALSQIEPGVYSFNPALHVPGSSIAKYSGSFPALVPITIVPQWQVMENQTRLIVSYQLAKDYPLESATLQNLSIAVSVTGGIAQSAHAKPLATFSRDKQRVTWRFNHPVELSKSKPERLVCQFITNGLAHEAPEGVEARFEIANAPTAIGLQTLVDGAWVPVKTAATAYTQRYTATSSQ